MGPNYCLLRPSHLDCVCLSLLASLCALPSSLLGADPFLRHPALLGPNHLSSLFSFLSSLATAHFSDRTSHLSLRTFNQTTESASNCIPMCLTIPVSSPSLRHHPWPCRRLPSSLFSLLSSLHSGIEPLHPLTYLSWSCLSRLRSTDAIVTVSVLLVM